MAIKENKYMNNENAIELYMGVAALAKYKSLHIDLQKIITELMACSPMRFSISAGYRSTTEQFKLWKEGKSKIDGVTELGKHNIMPSLAVDIFPLINKKANFDRENMIFLSGAFMAVANKLLSQLEIPNRIRWGGNWNRDEVILSDQSFDDLFHFELDV
jgi:hypothetical protein